jgi:hypothetical protein
MRQIPIERLREVLTLDEKTGDLYWKSKIASKVVVGTKAGSVRHDGYTFIQIDKTPLLAHHIVFALTHGRWPELELDHINGNPADNRACNIREATRSENNYNRVTPSHNTSGIKGVFKQKRGTTWTVRLTVNKVLRRVGGFETKELAAEFLELWRSMAHGKFANNGVKT